MQCKYLFQLTMTKKTINSHLRQNKSPKYLPRLQTYKT
jgi:hypothetical protein